MIRVWEFFGNGDPFFGGSADDRVLYMRGCIPLFLRGWERTPCDEPAEFKTVEAAEAAVEFAKRFTQCGPREGALLSYMRDVA